MSWEIFRSLGSVFALVACAVLLAATPARSETLYGVGRYNGIHYPGVFAIDTETGRVGMVLPTPDAQWFGATDAPEPDAFYAVHNDNNQSDLYRIDTASWQAVHVGTTGSVEMKELAYDESAGTLYGTDYQSLYTLAGGTPTLVGPHGNRPSGDPIDNVWSLDASGTAGEPLQGSVWYNPADPNSDAYAFDQATGDGTRLGPAGVDRMTDVCFSSASGTLYGISNSVPGSDPPQIHELDADGAVVESTTLSQPLANILGLGNVTPPGPAPTAVEPAPVLLQPGYTTRASVDAGAAIFQSMPLPQPVDEDHQEDSDDVIDGSASAGALASVDVPGIGESSSDGAATLDAQQTEGRVELHSHIEYAFDGNAVPDYFATAQATCQAGALADLLIEPTDTVPAGQPGRLIVDVGWVESDTIWEVEILDASGSSVLYLCSEAGDNAGRYEADITVGEVYSCEYELYGEWVGDSMSPPGGQLSEHGAPDQWITFGAIGEVPEPGTLGLLAVAGLGVIRRRRRRRF